MLEHVVLQLWVDEIGWYPTIQSLAVAVTVHDDWDDVDESEADEEAVVEEESCVELLFSSSPSFSGGPMFQ